MISLLTEPKNRNFLRLWLAQFISQFGDRIHQLALVGLIAQRAPGSTVELAKLMAFTILPVFIIQPFAGVFVDRLDRRTTLFVCDIIRGSLILTIPYFFLVQASMIPIYIIVFLAFCFSRFYVPAKMSIIPELVEEESLLKANSLVTTTGMIAFVFGAAFGGLLIEHYGARNGFIMDAITFFVSAVLLCSMELSWRLRINREKLIEAKNIVIAAERSVWTEIKEAFRYLSTHKEIRFVITILFALLAAAGAIYVVLIVFIQKVFGSVTRDLGILAVCLGVGLFCGVMTYGKWGKKWALDKTIFSSLAAGGAALTLFAVFVYQYSNIWMAMGLAFLWGLTVGPIFIAANTMVHTKSDAHMHGKVFSALEMVMHFAFLVAMLLSATISTFIDEVWILVGVGVGTIFLGMTGFLKGKMG